MQRKTIQQEADDLRLFWRGYACGLFQKGLALNLLLGILSAICKLSIVQAHSDTAALGTGMIFTLPENGTLHGSERHCLERHPSGRVTKILLDSGEIAEDHDVVKIIHWEMFTAEIINDHIVVLLRKLPFLLGHRTQGSHARSVPFSDKA